MVVSSYNAKDCTVMLDGVYVTQLGESMVSFEKSEAYFETSVGAQGDIVKSEINNSLHTLTITIQPTSPQKALLLSKCGAKGTFPVWVTNKSLGERFGGSMAAIQEAPSLERGAEAEDMEFTICVFDGVVENI